MVPIELCEIRPLQHVQKLELNPLDIPAVQIVKRFKHHILCLIREKKDHMDDHRDAQSSKSSHCSVKYVQVITAADEPCSLFVNSLKPQLYPHRLYPIQPPEKLQDITAQTVRTGGYGERPDVRVLYSFCEDLFQPGHGRIGVCKRLEICDVRMHRTLCQQILFTRGELLCYGEGSIPGKIAGAFCTAENAAACSDVSVPVGARHSAVQCDLVYLFSKHVPEAAVQGIVAPSAPAAKICLCQRIRSFTA